MLLTARPIYALKTNLFTRQRLRQAGITRLQAEAFTFMDDLRDVAYDWHDHAYHQLLYSFSGTVRLETKSNLWLLPPYRAAWIPARVRHRTIIRRAMAGSVYFDRKKFSFPGLDGIRVFSVTPLLPEMITYSLRWPNRKRERNVFAASFYRTLALYCRELGRDELSYYLPRGKSKVVQEAVAFTLDRLESVAMPEVAREVGASERSLRRHFQAETGLNWSDFLLRARLLHAIEYLAQQRKNVTETAYACGFSSLSAFSKAFANFTGQNPGEFRKRMR